MIIVLQVECAVSTTCYLGYLSVSSIYSPAVHVVKKSIFSHFFFTPRNHSQVNITESVLLYDEMKKIDKVTSGVLKK